MRHGLLVLLGILGVSPLLAQSAHEPVTLDSGTVVRLHWAGGSEKARLLAPFGWDSVLVWYCRYPSPVCGESSLNQPRVRPVETLTRLDVRHGSRTRRGMLIGAGFGALGGLLVLQARALGDAPPLTSGQQILTVASLTVAWGAIGALIGAASDDWRTVP